MATEPMELRFASETDRGRVRDENEDAVLADVPLVAVADGMGGHQGGEVASKLALEILGSWKDRLTGRTGSEATRVLRDAFAEANRTVWERGQQEEGLLGMGTTLTAGWIDGNTIALAHVGDSRAYLLRGSVLQQLTEDQTAAQELARRGRLTEDEAVTSPQRHYLLQAIGVDPDAPEVEISTVQLRPGDRILFATDGLYGMVKDPDRIRSILTENADPAEACRVLVREANAAGGEDNVSVLIIDALGDATAAASGGDTPPDAVVIEKEDAAPPARPRRRIPRAAALVAAAALLAIVIGALLVSRVSDDQLLVAQRAGNVAILKGRPGNEDRPARGDVVRVFRSERVDRFPRTVREDLRVGIPVETLAEAEQVIENLPRLLGPRDTPTPEPSPVDSPTPGPRSTLPPGSPAP